jgi:hypothetical protein
MNYRLEIKKRERESDSSLQAEESVTLHLGSFFFSGPLVSPC